LIRIARAFLSLVALGSFSASLFLVSAPVQAQGRELPDFADLVERTGPAVVNIRTTERRSNNVGQTAPRGPAPGMPELDENDPMYEFFRRFMPPRNQNPGPQQPNPRRGGNGDEVPRGVGSGFIIGAEGFLLSNHHVVDGADEVYVTLTDKREFKARIVGSDRRTDVALLKIEATGLPVLRIGDVGRLRVGEWVVAIGSPFGLENTVTAGIVSAKARDTGDLTPFIQTDVAVNPGNSGGPLINMRGEVVGINSQIYSRTGGFMGISFAIPIDEAMRVADQLRTTGRVVRGRIGVSISEVTKDVAEALGLPRAAGAQVTSVEKDAPAEKGGVEAGDIITKFEGKAVEKSSDLPRFVGSTRPGSKATITVWRKGASRDLTVTVAEMPSDRQATPQKPAAPTAPPAIAANLLGLGTVDLTDDKRKDARIKNGILVERAEGPAASAGIRQGDIVQMLNQQDVTSAKQFNELVAKIDRSKPQLLLVRRGDTSNFITVRPSQAK
jgi:serine protease Do